ncbi:DUF2142 domain-containing protein [Rugosimonospora africana]|uniref:Uncharacterized protein n=1 Tax=Rugosimonospora africana TaxID=556532 RepID=A0A8J3QPP5_9ACTN|nr:DUF2142 domain-containing protein [Rugosimonospora africana]GIH13967.1 hypothetical protein Raf01_21390 [Rugosimonospora africana]
MVGDQNNQALVRRRVRRYGLLAFVGFFFMIAAWSLAAPYDGTPDEQAHIIRAAGVDSGQVAPAPVAASHGSGAFQTVPKGLVRTNCWAYDQTKSAACATSPSADRTPVTVPTGAGRYNPVFYALVGWPLRLWPGWPGVLLARLICAAASAALFAGAFVSAMRWSRFRLLAVGLVAVATPMTLQMSSAVNPSGLEIAAGIALFASGVPLFMRPDGERFDRRLLWQVAIAAAILATLRAAGPLWLAFSALALLLPLRPSRIRRLWGIGAVRWCLAGLLVVGVAGVGWTVVQKATDLGDFRHTVWLSHGQATWAVLQQWREYTDELVGVMSWLDLRLPAFLYIIWELAVGALILAGVVLSNRLDRWRLFVVFLGGAVVPTLMQIKYVNEQGFVTQGRYLLPVLVGLVLMAAFIMEERGVGAGRARTIARLVAGTLLPLQIVALGYTMVRWQHGITKSYPKAHELNPLAGPWHPVVGSLTPLLVEVAGLVVVGALLWRTVGRPATELSSLSAAGQVEHTREADPDRPAEAAMAGA